MTDPDERAADLHGSTENEDPRRSVYANRTLNLRSVGAIGYDMDYTLIHYRVDRWETAAFDAAVLRLAERGVPTEGLRFEPDEYIRGLVLDVQLGNVCKASRFGYVIQARHGTQPIPYPDLRDSYSGVFVDLQNPRFHFINTLFSLSAASLYAQLVDMVDDHRLPPNISYDDVLRLVSTALDETHMAGELKARIVANPDEYCVQDPGTAAALVQQYEAGKKVVLITNSEWEYTDPMMEYSIGQFLDGLRWRDLFELVVVAAAKPRFFDEDPPAFEIVDTAAGLMRPHFGPYRRGAVYHGGSARGVETSLGLAGDEILYVGDHLFGDVHASKANLRWRTALIMRELEGELDALEQFEDKGTALDRLMIEKDGLQRQVATARTERDRLRVAEAPRTKITEEIDQLLTRIRRLDARIAPLAVAAADRGNKTWGLLMRAGSDKSMFARQVERHADIYTSRVSNLALRGPHAYFRAAPANLPHDRGLP